MLNSTTIWPKTIWPKTTWPNAIWPKAIWVVGAILGTLGCSADDGGRGAGLPLDADRGAGASLGTYEFTYGWVATESSHPGDDDTEVYDAECNALATVPLEFWDALALEGTGRLEDGTTLSE